MRNGNMAKRENVQEGTRSAFSSRYICDALRDLASFVQFKKCEKQPWRSVTFPTTLLKLTLLHRCFTRFLNCTNDTKSRNASYMLCR